MLTLTRTALGSHPVAEWTAADVRAWNVTTQSVTQLTDAVLWRRTFVDVCSAMQIS